MRRAHLAEVALHHIHNVDEALHRLEFVVASWREAELLAEVHAAGRRLADDKLAVHHNGRREAVGGRAPLGHGLAEARRVGNVLVLCL